MQKALLIKVALVLFLALLINIPLGMMSNLVDERQGRQNQVATDISNSYAEPQFMAGPLLVLPYTEEYTVTQEIQESEGGASKTKVRTKRHSSMLLLTPKSISASGALLTDIKKRSLFEVPVYTLDSTWEGSFELAKNMDIPRHASNSNVVWGTPYLSLSVKDPRGFANAPVVELDGKPLMLEQGSGVSFAPNGVKAKLDRSFQQQAGSHPFKLSLKLRVPDESADVGVLSKSDTPFSWNTPPDTSLKATMAAPSCGSVPEPSSSKITSER